MSRTVLTAAALALGLSLAPTLVAADDTPMCAEGMVPMSLPTWLLPAVLDTVERAAPAQAPSGAGEVLWCRSAYDTRCSPLRSDADALFSSLAHSLMAPPLVSRPSLPAPPVRQATFVDVRLGPCDGARSRLDRPPR